MFSNRVAAIGVAQFVVLIVAIKLLQFLPPGVTKPPLPEYLPHFIVLILASSLVYFVLSVFALMATLGTYAVTTSGDPTLLRWVWLHYLVATKEGRAMLDKARESGKSMESKK